MDVKPSRSMRVSCPTLFFLLPSSPCFSSSSGGEPVAPSFSSWPEPSAMDEILLRADLRCRDSAVQFPAGTPK